MVEDLETSHLGTNCPSQVGNVYNRPVSFQILSVCVDSLLGGGVLVLNHYRTASCSRQDGNSTGQDGKCDQHVIVIHYRMVGGAKVRI